MLLGASNLPTAELLVDFVWVFTVGTAVVALLHRWRLPSLLGFLVTGLLVGPAGFGLVQDRAAIEIMADIGIILLMFTIGLEVSLRELARIAKLVLGGGMLQIGLTAAAVAGIAAAAGLAWPTAVTIGLIMSASSTALVLRLLGDRGDLRTPFGQLSLAILLMQDFAVVGLMLILPMLAAGSINAADLGMATIEAVVISGGIVLAARFVFPWVLARVVDLRSREVFLLTSVLAVFGTAMIADYAGLSLALGAFLAGLVISESEFSHQMSAEVLPFRDVLNGLFFVSVGLLVDRAVVLENLGPLIGFIAATMVLKAVIVIGVAKAMRLSNVSALLAGVALSQVGEFALLLAQQAASLKLISGEQHSLVIALSVITMALTPLILPLAVTRLSGAESDDDLPTDVDPFEDHVIIIGYGLNGRNVARALRQLDVSFVAVEMNRTTVEIEKARGVPIVYGDATRPALLHHLHIEKARALVACVADAATTREVVAFARHANPNLLIVARTRYVAEIEPLIELGASSVVPEEFETSLELIARVMRAYGASEGAIDRERRTLRAEQYRALLHGPDEIPPAALDVLRGLDVAQIELSDDSCGAGCNLASLDLRQQTGTTAVAIIRGGETIPSPSADFTLQPGDVLVLVGDVDSLERAEGFLR